MPGPDTRQHGRQHVLCTSVFHGGHSRRGPRGKVVHAMAGVCATIPSAHRLCSTGCAAVVASEHAWDIPTEPRAEHRQGWTVDIMAPHAAPARGLHESQGEQDLLLCTHATPGMIHRGTWHHRPARGGVHHGVAVRGF